MTDKINYCNMTAEIVRPDKKDYSRDWDGLLAMNAEFETYIDHLEQSHESEVGELVDCMKKLLGDTISLKLLGHDMDDVAIITATRLIKNTIKSK